MYGELRPEAGARLHAHVTAVSGVSASDGDKPDAPPPGRRSGPDGGAGQAGHVNGPSADAGSGARQAPAAAGGDVTRRSPFAGHAGVAGQREGAAPAGDGWALHSGGRALAAGQAATGPLREGNKGAHEAPDAPAAARHLGAGPGHPAASPGPAGLRSWEPAGEACGDPLGRPPVGGPSSYPALWHRAGWAAMGGRMIDRRFSAPPAHMDPVTPTTLRPPAPLIPGARDEERGEAGADPGSRACTRGGGAGALQSVAEDQGPGDGARAGGLGGLGPGALGHGGALAQGGRPQGAQLDTRPSFQSWDNPWE